MTVEELAELVIDHMEFHGMDTELWLLDLQSTTKLCNSLQEDSKYAPIRVINHFCMQLAKYDDCSENNMTYGYKAIMSILDDALG